MRILAFSAALLVFTSTGAVHAEQSEKKTPKFDFALIGDMPYNNTDQVGKFNNLIASTNGEKLAFLVHDGDFKSGGTLCDNETFLHRKNLFDTSKHPFIYIPGDNEWTDCHRANNGSYDPLERLQFLRDLFYPTDRSLGQRTLQLVRQSDDPAYAKFRENVRWSYGDVMFVGLHVVGSNDNLGRTSEMDSEHYERNAANLSWMKQAFALAKENDHRGIMLVMQANPEFELSETDPRRSGYNAFLAELEAQTLAFAKPVVLVHGDSHYFRIDKPLIAKSTKARIENFSRVETFGAYDVHWLRVTVDPKDPNLFMVNPVIVEANRINLP